MSTSINKEALALVRPPVIEFIRNAAEQDGIAIEAEAIAVASQPGLMFVNAPVSDIGAVDFGAILEGRPVLNEVPIMYWCLSGERFAGRKSPVPAGFYTVVANERRRRICLKDGHGKTVAEGDLNIGVDLSGGRAEKRTITGGIDGWDHGWTWVKVCGHVKVCDGKKCVTVSGCTTVSIF